MSLFGALFSSVSSLTAHSQAIGMISDNIANLNAVGYKKVDPTFATLVTQSRTAANFSPGGVAARANLQIDRQGLLQSSSSSTDLAISGNGFFVVNTSSQPSTINGQFLYTRAGSFTKDQDGFLKNTAGLYLQGWPIDSTGQITSNRSNLEALRTVNVGDLTGTAEPTTKVSLKANLQASLATSPAEATYDPTVSATNIASGGVTPDFVRSLQIFDSQGTPHTMTIGALKSATPNQWHIEVYIEPASQVVSSVGSTTDGQIATGTLAFNTDGTLDTTTTSASLLNTIDVTWDPSIGVAVNNLNINWGTDNTADGFTQFDSPSNLVSSSVNGAVFGGFTGVSIQDNGVVTAVFSNGVSRDIFQIPVAIFNAPNELSNVSGNAFLETEESGTFSLQEASKGGAGTISAGALEASTVDLSEEFTDMITTQQAYSAASRVITTADDLLDELIRVIR